MKSNNISDIPQRVVIIGSGLGGLACGIILAKNGYEVTILEQSAQAGGCLQCFHRHGAIFETGMHYVGSALPGQTLWRLLHYLEVLPTVRLSQLNPQGYDVISLAGNRYAFSTGRENFVNLLSQSFPQQREALNRYFDTIEAVANASSLHTLKFDQTNSTVKAEYQLRSIDEVIGGIISDPILAHVLVGNLPLYAAEVGKTPFSVHAFITDFYNQSAFRFVGGSGKVVAAMTEVLQHHGGRLRTNCKVSRIVCDDTHAVAIETAEGERIDCDYVISDAHPKRTLEMLQTHLIRPAFRHRVESLPQTTGVFSLYLHFKPNSVEYMNHNFFGYSGESPWHCEDYDEISWPKGYLYMHFCDEPQQRFANSGVILSYMNYEDVARWAETTVGRRGEDYGAFKERKAQKLMAAVERDFPGLSQHIAHYYTATPLTYRDYTGTERGSMYGIAKDVHSPSASRIPQRWKVPNVLQTGQNINSHGMLGVLVGAIVTCSELVRPEEIYKELLAC
ncbi:MAG: phytoene desaturase family protein [Prevotella sp.]